MAAIGHVTKLKDGRFKGELKFRPKYRVPTRPSISTKRQRLESKTKRAKVKRLRSWKISTDR